MTNVAWRGRHLPAPEAMEVVMMVRGRSVGIGRIVVAVAWCGAMLAAAVGAPASAAASGRSAGERTLAIAAPSSAPSATCRAYVIRPIPGSMSVIDTATRAVSATVSVGRYSTWTLLTRAGDAYVVGNDSASVTVVDTATNLVSSTIPVESIAKGVAASPDGTRVYITGQSGTDGAVGVIDTVTKAVTATISAGSNPHPVGVAPDGRQIYVADATDGTVSIIDTDPSRPTYHTVIAAVATDADPRGLVVSPDGARVYVTDAASDQLVVIDTATAMVSATVSVGSAPYGLAMTPDGARVYVANLESDTVSVVDTATNMVSTTVLVGSFPVGVAVSPDGREVYVTNYADGTVSVIDTATNSESARIQVGTTPQGVAFGPCEAERPVLPPPPPVAAVERVAGADRFGTAVAVSEEFAVGPQPVVYVASGAVFADALVAGSSAADAGGSVLLVERDAVPADVLDELQRAAPGEVVIVGGLAAVSASVERTIAELGLRVRRVAGADRYATAAEVSKAAFAKGAPVVYVASGVGFADALPAGVVASLDDGPVLLVRPDGVPAVTAAELARLRPERIVLVGGQDAVGAAVETALAGMASGVVRIAGADRYATSVALSQSRFAAGVPVVFLASGERFPDALTAVAHAGRLGGPVLLARPTCVPPDVVAEVVRLQPRRVIAVGGPVALGSAIDTLTPC